MVWILTTGAHRTLRLRDLTAALPGGGLEDLGELEVLAKLLLDTFGDTVTGWSA